MPPHDEPAAGSDEEARRHRRGRIVIDADAVVPEDFVPGFVADDLTDTGAHTSATPEPAAPQPPAPGPYRAATTQRRRRRRTAHRT